MVGVRVIINYSLQRNTDKTRNDMEGRIYDIVTDLLRDDITKDKAIEELLVLCDVSKQRELLNAFVDKYNDRVYGDKRICNDEVGIYLDGI